MRLITSIRLGFCLLVLVSFSFSCTHGEESQSANQAMEKTNSETVEAETKSPRKMSLGEKTFIMCQACHTVKEGEPHKVGPNLYGFLGQKAASKAGFSYSDALKNSDIVWNEEHLRNWMQKPTDYIPGTIMAFIGIENEDQQTALIEYLKEQTQ